jgi:hypothetical protein
VRSGQIALWHIRPHGIHLHRKARDDDESTNTSHSAAGCHRDYVGLRQRNSAAGRACSRTRQHPARWRIRTRFWRIYNSASERRHYEFNDDLRIEWRLWTGIGREGGSLPYLADIVNLVSSLRIGARASSGSVGARNFDSRSRTITLVR